MAAAPGSQDAGSVYSPEFIHAPSNSSRRNTSAIEGRRIYELGVLSLAAFTVQRHRSVPWLFFLPRRATGECAMDNPVGRGEKKDAAQNARSKYGYPGRRKIRVEMGKAICYSE